MSNAHRYGPYGGREALHSLGGAAPPPQRSPWARALAPVIWVLCGMAMLAWLRFGLDLWHTTLIDTQPPQGTRTITVGAHVLTVPTAMLAEESPRMGAGIRLMLA